MKFKNIMSAMLLAGVFTVTSCSQEEIETTVSQADSKAALKITVSDTGVKGDAATRATDNGYATTFVAGDAIGVYGVKDNRVVDGINNKKFTLQDDGTWKVTGEVIEYTEAEMGDIKFFAYYPYCETDDARLGGATFDAASSAPFAEFVSNWTLDYAEAASYTSNDLMISKSTSVEANGAVGELNFTMSHCMAVAAVKLAGKTYKFDNVPAIADYVVPADPIDFKITQGAGEKEVKNAYYDEQNGLYRILVKPNTAYTVAGSYNMGGKMEYSKDYSGSEAGKVVKFEVASNAAAINHTLQAGDYYCADGSIVAKDATAPANAVGVVFFAGNPQPSAIEGTKTYTEYNDALRRDYPNAKHGLVIALNNSLGSASKFSTGKDAQFSAWVAGSEWDGKFVDNIVSVAVPAYLGYNHTTIMEKCPRADLWDFAKTALDTYRNGVAVPLVATEWFIPSLYEYETLTKVLNDVNTSIAATNGTELVSGLDMGKGTYWSSNERAFARVVYQHNLTEGSVLTANRDLGSTNGLFRFTLAF